MRDARRATVAGLAVATAAALLGDMMLYTVLPTRHADAGVSVAALGVLLSVHRFIRLGANSVVGLLNDRVGRRRPFLLGMALAVVATTGYLLARGFWPLFAARLVWGLAYALISVGALSILLDVTTPADRGRAVGGYHALTHVGALVALLLSGVLADLIGYRATLAVFAPLTALGWLVAFVVLGETRPGRPPAPPALGGGEGWSSPRGRPAEAAGAVAWSALGAAYRGLDRRLLVPGFVSFATFFAGNGVLMATLGVHLATELAAPGAAIPLASLTGLLLGSRRAASIVAAPAAGHLSDRFGERRRVAGAGLVTGLAGFAVLATGRGLTAIVVGVALTALGEGMLLPSVAAWAGDLTPPALRGVTMGGLATANDLGGATGPLVGYALGAALGFRAAYGLCAALFVAALTALLLVGPAAGRLPVGEPVDSSARPG